MTVTQTHSDVAILGGGAWGTALAQAQASVGRNVLLWAREPEVVNAINTQHENISFLKGVALHPNVRATAHMTDLLAAPVILVVTPAQHMRTTLAALGPKALAGKTIILCAKGIEIETGALLSHIVMAMAPEAHVAVLSGPTFAADIARGLPCAVTLAAPTMDAARTLAAALGTKTFRPYASDDVVGAEIGGAIKNVIAIACGIVMGRAYGDSARAALLTRGMSEMMRLALAMGGRRETLMGMCGLGDLMLTASSMLSRNFSLGVALGEGQSLKEIMAGRNSVAEGVHTARAVVGVARSLGLELPVLEAVNSLLHDGQPVEAVINQLLARPFTDELTA